ncbi:MAG: hypothetical protein AMXMBFR7_49880 [Planctomycetota bacterium]
MWLLEFLSEPWGKMISVGLFLLAIGGGLTLWSYLHRDPVTGEFYIWPKMLIAGIVSTVFGISG